MALDWSRWTTNPYYALVILIVACGSIPKGAYRKKTPMKLDSL